MTLSLETRMTTPAYFSTLTVDELDTVINTARETIFSDTASLDEKQSAGVRLHYGRITRDGVSLAFGSK
jgi:hypothetical protein